MAKIQADWLTSAITVKVVDALGPENVRFVGGAVRDTLIGRPVHDIDAATRHKPERCKALLEAAGLKVIPTGLKHGTVTAVWAGDVMEITTLRVDVNTDGRRADVAFTEDWLEDAKRRDFTFNALYASADGEVFDPFGGIEDLQSGVVRFIGDAEARIEEDALRILRFFRFYARYGKGPANAEALQACKQKVDLLDILSIERIRDELLKLLSVIDPMPTLRMMLEADVLTRLVGEEAKLEGLARYLKSPAAQRETLVRFYFLLAATMDAKSIGRHFKLSNQETGRLFKLEQALGAELLTQEAVRRAVYLYGNEATRIAVGLNYSGEERSALMEVAESWSAPCLPVQGRDLIELGMPPGRDIGQTLKRLERLWIESDFSLGKAELLQNR